MTVAIVLEIDRDWTRLVGLMKCYQMEGGRDSRMGKEMIFWVD